MYWAAAVVIVTSFTGIERFLFTITGENLTASVRKQLLRGLLFKQLCWFDTEKRAPGVLTNIISEDVTQLNGMTTETIATLLEAVGSILLGFVITIFLSWRTAVAILLFSPILVVGIIAQARLEWGNKGGGKGKYQSAKIDPYEKATALLSDVIQNYKTVIGFGDKNSSQIIDKFEGLLVEP